tara:strand:- start:4051 stop:5001 length:951 start_codon:yes stop_codon:yes gene_type:complete
MGLTKLSKEKLSNNLDLVVSVSGGKDSTATCLYLLENGYTTNDFERVFFDTGWESKETYDYLDYLETKIGKITRLKKHVDISQFPKETQQMILEIESDLGFESPFVRLCFYHKCMPSRFRKWCTRSLKLEVVKDYFDNHDNDVISIIGVRRAESRARANVEEWDYHDHLDCDVWRPLYLWSEKDVIDIHNKHNILPNNLYLQGSSRVGCYPCIYAKKKEISILSTERIKIIEKLEKYTGIHTKKTTNTQSQIERLEEVKEKYGYYFNQFFSRKEHDPFSEVVLWSKTTHGGKQFKLFDTDEPSCSKWGLCSVWENK